MHGTSDTDRRGGATKGPGCCATLILARWGSATAVRRSSFFWDPVDDDGQEAPDSESERYRDEGTDPRVTHSQTLAPLPDRTVEPTRLPDVRDVLAERSDGAVARNEHSAEFHRVVVPDGDSAAHDLAVVVVGCSCRRAGCVEEDLGVGVEVRVFPTLTSLLDVPVGQGDGAGHVLMKKMLSVPEAPFQLDIVEVDAPVCDGRQVPIDTYRIVVAFELRARGRAGDPHDEAPDQEPSTNDWA